MLKIHFLYLIILFRFNLELLSTKAQNCGRKINSEFAGNVYGGEKTNRTEWPWNVALIHRQDGGFFCGGTLISDAHILSAAHCFQYKGNYQPLSPFLVEAQLGKFDLSIKKENGSVILLVVEIVIHPDWKIDKFAYDADLSIVVLERKVTFNIFIYPICLPKQSDDYVTGNGTVVGWGRSETSGGTFANVPSKLELPAVNDSMCLTTFSKLAEYYSTRMFCGGFVNLTKAPCLGDSGGGFYFLNQDENFWAVQGIVSGSLSTMEYGCDINKFSLFTNVAKFAEWIKEKMKETMTEFVKFDCEKYGNGISLTICSTTFNGTMTRHFKIRTDFSSHKYKNSPIGVAYLDIDFSPSTHVLSGIGEEFPNLRRLKIRGDSIEYIDRHKFVNMTQLEDLKIIGFSLVILPEDLLLDLPDLEILGINGIRKLESLPEKLFMNQIKLKSLHLSGNGLRILQKDLFQNNLKLEEISLNERKLEEIYVDFTLFPALEEIDLEGNKCFRLRWKPENESIQSFQDKIIHSCQPSIITTEEYHQEVTTKVPSSFSGCFRISLFQYFFFPTFFCLLLNFQNPY